MGERIKKLKKIRIHREGTNELTLSALAIVGIGSLLWYGLDTTTFIVAQSAILMAIPISWWWLLPTERL